MTEKVDGFLNFGGAPARCINTGAIWDLADT